MLRILAALTSAGALLGGCVEYDSPHSGLREGPICPTDIDGCPDAGEREDAGRDAGRDAGPPPAAVPCRVTGGGQIVEGARPDSFGGNAQPFRGGMLGHWNHVTHDDGHLIGRPTSIECFNVAGDPADPPSAPANAARFTGTGRFGGETCTFEVYVEDHGEPGTDDVYEIDIDCPTQSYSAGGTLLHGNIQIHAVPPGHMPR